MIAIKGMEIPSDCKKCHLMATDGLDILSPMMCIALWATKREIKHCVEGKILDDCPLVEIVTCKDCKYYFIDEDGCGYHCEKSDSERISTCVDFYCIHAEKRE